MTLVDRWILDRLEGVIAECRSAYQAYEFHKVYHTLNQFCAVDLSSLYIDITKDRMYCDAPDSPRRRATQMAMHRLFDALCRLLAPIMVFTADEAWGYLDASDSVHLQLFPEQNAELRNPAAENQVAQLLNLRAVIGQAVERARQEKLIGNALEAAVVLRCDQEAISSIPNEQLEEFFILSELRIEPGKEPSASISKTTHAKCARCWRHRPAVGKSAAHPELCDRCENVVTASAIPMKFILLLSLPLYALDQITKWFVLRHVQAEELRVVIPDFFSLVHVTNTGAAFGSFRNNNLVFHRPFLCRVCFRPGVAPSATLTGHVARRFARPAPGRHHGKSDRSFSARPCDRFFALRSAHPVRASLAGL